MIQQNVFSFKLEITKERLTAHGGLALMAEYRQKIAEGLYEGIQKYISSSTIVASK